MGSDAFHYDLVENVMQTCRFPMVIQTWHNVPIGANHVKRNQTCQHHERVSTPLNTINTPFKGSISYFQPSLNILKFSMNDEYNNLMYAFSNF